MNPVRKAVRTAFALAPQPVRRGLMAAIGRPPPPPRPRRKRRQPTIAPPPIGFNVAYVGPRPDLVERLPTTCRSVLDLGCATGEVGLAIRSRIPEARVTGVEVDPAMAELAATRMDRVVVADLNDVAAVTAALGPDRFDGVIAGDILEHLVDPWTLLRRLSDVLVDDAWIVASLPNIGYWDTWWNVIVRRRWPYRTRGIHDATHLRFFAGRNLAPLFSLGGFRIERVVRNYRIVERAHRWNAYAGWLAIPGLRDLMTFQFVVVARRDPGVVRDARPDDDRAAELLPG